MALYSLGTAYLNPVSLSYLVRIGVRFFLAPVDTLNEIAVSQNSIALYWSATTYT